MRPAKTVSPLAAALFLLPAAASAVSDLLRRRRAHVGPSRDVEASVSAHGWPTTVRSPLCEAWAYLDSSPSVSASDENGEKGEEDEGGEEEPSASWAYLDALTSPSLSASEGSSFLSPGSYRESIELALSAAASSSVSSSSSSSSYADTLDGRLLRYSLSLRANAPLCELHRGSARDAAILGGLYDPSAGRWRDGSERPDAFGAIHPGGNVTTSASELLNLWHAAEEERAGGEEDGGADPREDALLPDEKVRPRSSSSPGGDDRKRGRVAILYGNVGTRPFARFYETLISSRIDFVVRHMGPIDYEETGETDEVQKTRLQGYGVRMDVRNVEYKAFEEKDDDKVHKKEDRLTDEDVREMTEGKPPEDAFLGGINLATLADRFEVDPASPPDGWRDLRETTLKSHAAQSSLSQIIPPVWQRRYLALQASVAISSSIDPLLTLQDVSQNLPSLASSLVHVSVPPEIRSMAESMKRLPIVRSTRSSDGKGGSFGFYVNGRRIVGVERPTFNAFELLDGLREEDAVLKRMSKRLGKYFPSKTRGRSMGIVQECLGMGGSALDERGDRVYKPPSSESDDDDHEGGGFGSRKPQGQPKPKKIRIDVGTGWKKSVIYVNDVETGPQYAHWPTSMQNVFMALQYGAPPSIRRNLFTVLAVLDPTDGKGLAGNPGFNLGFELMRSQYPVRLGVVLVDEKDTEGCPPARAPEEEECAVDPIGSVNGSEPAKARDVHRLFSSLTTSRGGLGGVSFLIDVVEIAREKKDDEKAMTIDDVLKAYVDVIVVASAADPNAVVDSTDEIREDAVELLTSPEPAGGNRYGKGLRFASRKGIKGGMSFLNGLPLPTMDGGGDGDNDDPMEATEAASRMFQEEQNEVVQRIMRRQITERRPKSVYAMFLKADGVHKRYHPLLKDPPTGGTYVDVPHDMGRESLLRPSTSLSSTSSSSSSSSDDDAAIFVVEAVLDLDSAFGLSLASSFLETMDSLNGTIVGEEDDEGEGGDGNGGGGEDKVDVAYRIVPSTPSSYDGPLGKVFRKAGRFDAGTLRSLVDAAVARDDGTVRLDVRDIEGASDEALSRLKAARREEDDDGGSPAASPRHLTKDLLPAANFLAANGRVYVPETDAVSTEDIDLLLSLELKRARALTRLLRPHVTPASSDGDFDSHDAVGRAATFLGEQFAGGGGAKGAGAKYGTSKSSGDERTDVETQLSVLDEEGGAAAGGEKNPLRFVWNDGSEDEEGEEDGGGGDDGDGADGDDGLKVKVTAILDPLSEPTQRVAPLLRIIRDDLKLPLRLILVPRAVVHAEDTLPITSYYRFVADPLALPDARPPRATFANLPTNHVFTIRMDVPEPWNVQQVRAVQDTDNLRCDASLGCGDDAHREGGAEEAGSIAAAADDDDDGAGGKKGPRDLAEVEYGLINLLFFGQCYDATKSTPPNGLQLTLSKSSAPASFGLSSNVGGTGDDAIRVEVNPDGSTSELSDPASAPPSAPNGRHHSDTLVMKTVGYWQLPANPGVWTLGIAEDSRGSEIFDMVEGDARGGRIRVDETRDPSRTKRLVMKDFVSTFELLLVKRREGHEDAQLFYADEEEEDDAGRAPKAADDEGEEVVHVFSLATGHTYERLLKIMMLSVTKRTSVPVKFWLFENYLSPTFKSSARHMASRTGCEVEFVTYKWPEWLRGQSEKQRIIWGYKILFLDVLFPLNVKKIIYVDADQVVRGDLKELRDMDLDGAPYGYTPFCDSRESTLGYQFWRTGFWQTHLRGKPYHISALYVVDLDRFRRELVGDILRGTYQQLSADPNSLSNLDQDLPNYTQHQVRIFSLPQEWLWCESWCSDETKPDAKTIDLCNNPEHKEPKISMAKRIISGELFQESWIELDEEVGRYDAEYRTLTAASTDRAESRH